MQKVVAFVAVALLVCIATADVITPFFDCREHIKVDYMGMFVEMHLMQDVLKGGERYYQCQNATDESGQLIATAFINCDYMKGDQCLLISRQGKTCDEDYSFQFPDKDEKFYYDKKEDYKCPYPTQRNCVLYTNTTQGVGLVIDSVGHEVELLDSGYDVKMEYFDDAFSPSIFATTYCEGEPLTPPEDFCSKH